MKAERTKVTKPEKSNCMLGLLYLVLRGKVTKLVGVTTKSPFWPVHFLAMNRWGHIVHFGLDDMDGAEHPWWYVGRFHVMTEEYARSLLEEYDRKLLWVFDFNWKAKIVLWVVALALLVPWLLGWLLYPTLWMIWYAWDAIKKNCRLV